MNMIKIYLSFLIYEQTNIENLYLLSTKIFAS